MLKRFTDIFRHVLLGNSFPSSGIRVRQRALPNTKVHENKNAQSDCLKMDDNNKNVQSDHLKMGSNGKEYPLSPFVGALMWELGREPVL